MFAKPRLYQTHLSFFGQTDPRVRLGQWTLALIGDGSTAHCLEALLSPRCQQQKVTFKHIQIPPPVLLEKEDGWALPLENTQEEAHVCLFAFESDILDAQARITQSHHPLVQHLLMAHLAKPNVSRRGLSIDSMTCSLRSTHRLAKTLFAVGTLTQEENFLSTHEIQAQCLRVAEGLFGF